LPTHKLTSIYPRHIVDRRSGAVVCKAAGPGPIPCRRPDGDGMNRQAGVRAFAPVEGGKLHVKKPVL